MIEAATARGWQISGKDDDEDVIAQEGCLQLREYPDEEGSFLQVSQFIDVIDAFERDNLGDPNGHLLEAKVKEIVALLDPPIADSDIEYDSEAGMMDVIFQHREDALRVGALLLDWIYPDGEPM